MSKYEKYEEQLAKFAQQSEEIEARLIDTCGFSPEAIDALHEYILVVSATRSLHGKLIEQKVNDKATELIGDDLSPENISAAVLFALDEETKPDES